MEGRFWRDCCSPESLSRQKQNASMADWQVAVDFGIVQLEEDTEEHTAYICNTTIHTLCSNTNTHLRIYSMLFSAPFLL